MGRVAIVILNWNGKHFMEKYLPALLKNTPAALADIVVTDNGSNDGSVAWLRKNFSPETVRLMEFDRNLGFTGGYNRALEQIDAEYFILLNSDVRVPSGWLEPLTEFMDTHPQAGICMPKILRECTNGNIMENPEGAGRNAEYFEYAGAAGGFMDKYGFPFCRGRILSCIEEDRGQYDDPREIFWASGAAMMIRSSLYRELGGLDERFFAHMEEIDLCWRAALLGYQVWAVPQSKVYHVGGGTLPNDSPHKLYLNYRNNLLMLYKNLPPDGDDWETMGKKGKHSRNLYLFKRKCIDGLSAAVYLLQGKPAAVKAVLRAHRDFGKMKSGAVISPRIAHPSLKGIYKKSIIFRFFSGRKKFSSLGDI